MKDIIFSILFGVSIAVSSYYLPKKKTNKFFKIILICVVVFISFSWVALTLMESNTATEIDSINASLKKTDTLEITILAPKKPKINSVQQSPNIKNIDNRGGTYIENQTINNLDIPEPKFNIDKIYINVKTDDFYTSIYRISIESKFPLENLYIQVNASNIIEFEPYPEKSGMMIGGMMGIRDTFAFANIQNASGVYILPVKTKYPSELNFSLGY